ncbi:hypothetical protein COCMIDRAFT_108850 [Bipolaris oryzae ATCC 44560]|uniref:Uncharacterized protein n=1 Tax=Bipolaris oryzae ATCC 44560 TaxID=930090 RepID=W6Z9Q5_COCMI|nr:uncharacterized protein COCMIDRAFT_108850 [Bipolaris oryzae ATCC 44560]EUC40436.1 hypothetical protein COCMIDRAFT_108850 [Bipolaris oryzae ATCC 44560]
MVKKNNSNVEEPSWTFRDLIRHSPNNRAQSSLHTSADDKVQSSKTVINKPDHSDSAREKS